MKSLERIFAIFMTIIGLMFFTISASEATTDTQKWEGIWFTCEHAQRQRAPDDGCQMFDNEGFEYRDGKLRYLEMKGSQSTNCKGQKKGHCFERALSAITVKAKPIGDARIENNLLIVRYWGCDQGYFMTEGIDYMTIKPKGKNCLWSQERHFYIAPYFGKVTYQKAK